MTVDSRTSGATGAAPPLLPYLPRLVVDWLQEAPDDRYRQVDGTMVFIDVSGFTALSERLARRGKAGAEELTEILDGIFANLLLRAWELGGGLVKFGGDALLLLFDGHGHADRGCAAAWDMRAALAAAALRETSAGQVRLKMSVGVHSGLFDFFLVGGSHRELLLTGPAASETVGAEGAAEADQIVTTSATAAALGGTDLVRPTVDERWFLEQRPATSSVSLTAPERAAPELLEQGVPLALRRHLASGTTEPEHRMVTVGFLHFMGVDGLLDAAGPEVTADALEAVVAAAQRHLDGHAVGFLGSDIYGDGGKLIFVAGAPEATGNDEERMLRAFRGLFDENVPLALRAGVNRGHVYSGSVGASMRRTYTVMGDAVNLAARLMQAATPGDVLVTQGVLDHSRATFDVTPLEPFFVKGKARPVQAFGLGAVTGRKRQDPLARLPLVGRDEELRLLAATTDELLAGMGGAVTIVGPAGVGKTRLVEELRVRLEGLPNLTALCEQYEAATPYWAVRWLLRRLLQLPFDASPAEAGELLSREVEATDPELLPWLPLLAAPVDATVASTPEVERLDPAYRANRLEEVTVDLMVRLLPSSALLVFEDAGWMDDASRSLVARLAARMADRPIGMVLTSREPLPDLVPEGDQERVIELAPLDVDAAAALAAAASELTPRPPHELRRLAERSGGNPLFLLELVAGAAPGETEALPATIEAAITARIDTLDPVDRILLRCASVLGLGFSQELASEALGEVAPSVDEPGSWDRLAEFLERLQGNRLRFRQALFRDVAYEGLPFRRRRDIHASVATRLEAAAGEEADQQAELLALHFLRAEQLDKAWSYARAAGHRARMKAATVEAASFYSQAVDAALQAGDLPPDEVLEVAELLGDVSELAGLYDDGARAYRTARRFARQRPARIADLLRKEGLLHERAGRYRRARLLYRSGRRLLARVAVEEDAEFARVRADLHVVTAASLIVEGRFRPGVWWARRALDLATAHDVKEVLAHAYYLLDWAYTDSGDAEAAAPYRGRAVPIYEELGDLDGLAKVLNNLGANAYYEGDWTTALGCYERSRQALQEVGNVVEAATVGSNIGEVLLQQGHLGRAEQMFREALAVLRGAGHRIGEAWALCNLGLIAGRSGDTAQGVALLTESREAFKAIGAESYALEAVARLAELSLLTGDHHNARSLISRALADAQDLGGLPFLEALLDRLMGYALLQAGDRDHAAGSFAASLSKAGGAGATYEEALTLQAVGRLERLSAGTGTESAERSHAILDALGVVATPDIPLPVTRGAEVVAPEGSRR